MKSYIIGGVCYYVKRKNWFEVFFVIDITNKIDKMEWIRVAGMCWNIKLCMWEEGMKSHFMVYVTWLSMKKVRWLIIYMNEYS